MHLHFHYIFDGAISTISTIPSRTLGWNILEQDLLRGTFWNDGAISTISTILSRTLGWNVLERRCHLDDSVLHAWLKRFRMTAPSQSSWRFPLARLVGTFWNDGAISTISTIPSRTLGWNVLERWRHLDDLDDSVSHAWLERFGTMAPSRRSRRFHRGTTFSTAPSRRHDLDDFIAARHLDDPSSHAARHFPRLHWSRRLRPL